MSRTRADFVVVGVIDVVAAVDADRCQMCGRLRTADALLQFATAGAAAAAAAAEHSQCLAPDRLPTPAHEMSN